MTLHRTILSLTIAVCAGFNFQASAVENESEVAADNFMEDWCIGSEDVVMPSLEELLGEPIDDFDDLDDFSEVLEELIDFSKTFIGTRYRLGATGPTAFDCSGFTGYVFRSFGFKLLRDSRSQGTQGVRVSTNEAQPGDLIFFSGRSAGKNIGHVGIVIEPADENGNVKFIHASTSNGVRIDSSDDAYYAKRFLGIRRIVDDFGDEIALNS